MVPSSFPRRHPSSRAKTLPRAATLRTGQRRVRTFLMASRIVFCSEQGLIVTRAPISQQHVFNVAVFEVDIGVMPESPEVSWKLALCPDWRRHDRESLCFETFSAFEQLLRKTAEVSGNVRAGNRIVQSLAHPRQHSMEIIG